MNITVKAGRKLIRISKAEFKSLELTREIIETLQNILPDCAALDLAYLIDEFAYGNLVEVTDNGLKNVVRT